MNRGVRCFKEAIEASVLKCWDSVGSYYNKDPAAVYVTSAVSIRVIHCWSSYLMGLCTKLNPKS